MRQNRQTILPVSSFGSGLNSVVQFYLTFDGFFTFFDTVTCPNFRCVCWVHYQILIFTFIWTHLTLDLPYLTPLTTNFFKLDSTTTN
ncbi:hypothetical protein PHMEG_00018707 [Phytophthora megakarya]|uniref:Uncharacterized protein n=1 Tax=Phytophthora megakarya TaxID=4795 RepID=A0A225VTR6_9STRA|nr:hypothetical protein PHMEG_00018707 [Phytophthora megakarya]